MCLLVGPIKDGAITPTNIYNMDNPANAGRDTSGGILVENFSSYVDGGILYKPVRYIIATGETIYAQSILEE